MTTNKARRHTLALILPLLLLAVGCDSQSAMVDPDPTDISAKAFMITSTQVAVSPTTSEGTFQAFGLIDDHGVSKEVLASAEPLYEMTSLHGKKTLEGQKGTLTIEYYLSLSPTTQNTIRANGGFGIVEGSGAYANLQGGGEIHLEVERNTPPAVLTRVLEGEARYVQ